MKYRELFGNNVAVIGASPDRETYSNKAVRALDEAGFTIYPVHPRAENVEGFPVARNVGDVEGPVDFVTVYIKPEIALRIDLATQLEQKGVKGAILNPGTQDEELARAIEGKGITILQECTLYNGLRRAPEDI